VAGSKWPEGKGGYEESEGREKGNKGHLKSMPEEEEGRGDGKKVTIAWGLRKLSSKNKGGAGQRGGKVWETLKPRKEASKGPRGKGDWLTRKSQ